MFTYSYPYFPGKSVILIFKNPGNNLGKELESEMFEEKCFELVLIYISPLDV